MSKKQLMLYIKAFNKDNDHYKLSFYGPFVDEKNEHRIGLSVSYIYNYLPRTLFVVHTKKVNSSSYKTLLELFKSIDLKPLLLEWKEDL
jgi:hypothetical protein